MKNAARLPQERGGGGGDAGMQVNRQTQGPRE